MKKILALTLIALLILTGCQQNESKEQLIVFSFHGSDEQLTITNGVIVLQGEDSIFSGGDLTVREDFLTDVTSCSLRYYFTYNNEDINILTRSITHENNSTISIEGYLGKISGEGTFLDTTDQEESITSLKNNLNFELKKTHSDGTENIYQIHMNLSEITSEYEMSMI